MLVLARKPWVASQAPFELVAKQLSALVAEAMYFSDHLFS